MSVKRGSTVVHYTHTGFAVATLLHSDGTGDATTTICHEHTPLEQLSEMTKLADIVITGRSEQIVFLLL